MSSSLEPQAPAPERRRSSRGRLVAVLCVLVAAVGVLLFLGLSSSLNYFQTVDQAVAERSSLGAKTIRLEGTVVKGSVERTDQGATFTLRGRRHEVRVVNTGTPPQMFQGDIPVVAVGHFAPGTPVTFRSNEIMVKHSSSYIADHPDRVKAKDGTVR